MKKLPFLIFGLSFWLLACQPQTHLVKTDAAHLKMEDLKEDDQEIMAMIVPYKKEVEKEMNTVIGQCAKMLTKGQPESTLGNWSADVAKAVVENALKTKVDFCMLNLGGLRIPSLPKGAITKGKIFELMPFDNTLLAVEMKGSDLKALFDRAAATGGWPISKEVKMTIYKEQSQNIMIDGKKVEKDKIYRVAMNDYMANGGDKCFFLKDKKKLETNLLMRNAIIEYIENLTKAGKAIDANIENRVFILK